MCLPRCTTTTIDARAIDDKCACQSPLFVARANRPGTAGKQPTDERVVVKKKKHYLFPGSPHFLLLPLR